MYRVYCDGHLLHDSNLEDYTLISPTLNLEVNMAGQFDFQITSDHINFDKIVSKKSYIEIYDDGVWLWSGRPITIKTAMKLYKTVTCEGELSFLHDSNQRLDEYHDISVRDYFESIIAKHNADVDASKQFVVGNVTVEDANDKLYKYSNYEDTFDTIKKKLIDSLGGYVYIRHENGVRYIDYLKDYPLVTNQIIQIGSNIIDIALEETTSEMISGLIPLGAKLNEETGLNAKEARVTIETVNDGLDYIVNDDAVERYGLILDVVKFDDVTEPSNLLRKGQDELTKRLYSNLAISLNIFDRGYIDANLIKFRLGSSVIAHSPKHNLDRQEMMISKISMSLVDISKTKIEIGITKKTMTGSFSESSSQFDTRVETIVSDYIVNEEMLVINPALNELSSKIEQTAESIRNEVSSNYINVNEKSSLYEYVASEIEQTASDITMTFNTQITNIEEGIVTDKTNMSKYIRFDGGIELGSTENNMILDMENDEVAFVDTTNASNHKKNLILAPNRFEIVNLDNGLIRFENFAFYPRESGNLSFTLYKE